VVDDFVALIVIATAYTDHIEAVPLAVAGGLFVTLFALRFAPTEWRLRVAVVVGWPCGWRS
jgi:Na+/H+ antiporter NhaA